MADPQGRITQFGTAVVEAEHDKVGWMAVPDGVFTGNKQEIEEKAQVLMNEWISKGWPEERIRITRSSFRTRRNINSPEADQGD